MNDVLYITILTYHMLEMRLKSSVRYADKLEEHPDTLAIDLMSDAETSRGLKRKLSLKTYVYKV